MHIFLDIYRLGLYDGVLILSKLGVFMIKIRLFTIFLSLFSLFISSFSFADESCDSPVNMMIISKVTDEEKYDEYRKAVVDINLIGKLGGQIVAVGAGGDVTPEMLEGKWPNNLFNYIIRWPCAKAAKDFWYSDGYQNKALPIRKDAGDFTIALFPAR